MTSSENEIDHHLLEEIKNLFHDAEGAMKSLEHIVGLFVPTVNQLRYAGHHILNYTGSKDREELLKAKRHCQRAIYDAYDVHIQYFIHEIELFEKQYASIVIADTFPNYIDFIHLKNNAMEFLENGYQSFENRENFYRKAQTYKKQLSIFSRDLPIMREQLNRKLEDKRKTAYFNWVMAFITILSAIIAVVTIIVS